MAAELLTIEPEAPRAGVVEKLETALERTRNGELSSCCIAVVYRDGCIGHFWSDAPSMSALLGSVQRLAHKLNLELDD